MTTSFSVAKPTVCQEEGCTRPYYHRGLCSTHYQRKKKDGTLGTALRRRPQPYQWLLDHKDTASDECLKWPFADDGKGYGSIRINNKTCKPYRVMCELVHGPAPTPEHHAAHNCGKGHEGCVNPNHLQWKTPQENHADKFIHGTTLRGSKSPHAKLTETDVLAIRSMAGLQKDIAAAFGVGVPTISQIKAGKKWSWL